MSTLGVSLDLASLTPVLCGAIVLVAATVTIHLWTSIPALPDAIGLSFGLAGIGCIGAIGLVLIGLRRRLVYLVAIPYVAAQIVLWYVISRPAGLGDGSGIEALDKTDQGVLIVHLASLSTREG